MPSDSYTIEEYVEILQKIYTANINRINGDESINKIDHIKLALIEAEKIWLNVQVLIKSPKYTELTDDQKINLIETDFKEFYRNFPVVSRYMICMGQYKLKAFKRMLINATNTTDIDDGEDVKKRNERQWIKRQADYVRFLWEEYQVKFDVSDSDKIWKQAYDNLTKEFNDFKELHEKMERKIKEDSIKHKKELLIEMGTRITSGVQQLDENSSKELLVLLKDKLFKQRFKKTMDDLVKHCNYVTPIIECEGSNEYAKVEYDNDIQQSYYKKKYKKMDINKIIA